MFYLVMYLIVSTVLLFASYYFILTKIDFFNIKDPISLSAFNFVLTLVFVVMYLFNPSWFSSDIIIKPKIVYYIFSVFSVYFYMLIMPLSLVQIIIMLWKKIYSDDYKKYVLLCFNIVSVIGILFLASSLA